MLTCDSFKLTMVPSEDVAPGEDIPDKPFPFFKLPPELRLNIYESFFEVLATSYVNEELKYTTALLYTNRQVFDEAAHTFARLKTDIYNSISRRERAADEEAKRIQPRCINSKADLALLNAVRGRRSAIYCGAMKLRNQIEQTADILRPMEEFKIEGSIWNPYLIE